MSEEGVRAEWRGWSLRALLVGTIYLLGTGLVILPAPFGSGAQVSVLAHTALGILFLVPFLFCSYPRHHKATFGRPLMETPEFCGACHKPFIDKEINRATRVQLQNQYDAWKGSHWFVPEPDNPQRADPERSLACRDCHMRLTASGEPTAVRRGAKHRHHGYIAANQWLPLFHDLPGAEKHVRLTEE